ncbi:hypothetical protein CERSUDRAFT_123830 [Gelatoporia subvermispora B]|uniref:Nephrocystin 3-like N-terminal domain-containing protein n=1 Tax=Ceriporiopsis subvermispora (strain B) TaxID=914234 RepID=M2RD75_CERS8|nr:hypothetical protein CERSUDRAFT_123830 [Gelatoporia subvermispora B]
MSAISSVAPSRSVPSDSVELHEPSSPIAGQDAVSVSPSHVHRDRHLGNIIVDNAAGAVGLAADITSFVPIHGPHQALVGLEFVLGRVRQARISVLDARETEDSINNLVRTLEAFRLTPHTGEHSGESTSNHTNLLPSLQQGVIMQEPVYYILGELAQLRKDAGKLHKKTWWRRFFSAEEDARIVKSIQNKVAEWRSLLDTYHTGSINMNIQQLARSHRHAEDRGAWERMPLYLDASYASIQNDGYRLHSGTRKSVLDQLTHWATTPDQEKRLLLLHGPVGTGKSSIARALSQQLDSAGPRMCEPPLGGAQQQDTEAIITHLGVTSVGHEGNSAAYTLGSSYFFHREDEPQDGHLRFFVTIAHQLARRFPDIGASIIDALHHFSARSPSIDQQFYKLILGPLMNYKHERVPIVIVIDGFDACRRRKDDVRLFEQMLQYLCQAAHRFPYLRILISTRLDPIILDILAPSADNAIHCIDLLEVEGTSADIEAYFRARLGMLTIPRGMNTFLSAPDYKKLVEYANGCFQYAKAIADDLNDARELAQEAYGGLLSSDGAVKTTDLDQQYATILADAFDSYKGSRTLHQIRLVLAMLALAQCPLSPNDLDMAIGIPTTITRKVVSSLRPLLHLGRAEDNTTRLRPHHINFSRFLCDEDRCKDSAFHVYPADCQAQLASQLLARLSIPNINAELFPQSRIVLHESRRPSPVDAPAGLRYACDHWMSHLCGAKHTDELLDALRKFLEDYVDEWIAALQQSQIPLEVYCKSFQSVQFWYTEAGNDARLSALMDRVAQNLKSRANGHNNGHLLSDSGVL